MSRSVWNDDTPMPWGEHKGKRLGDIPAVYLYDLSKKPWIAEYRELSEYIKTNQRIIERQAAEEDHKKGSVDDGLDSYEDYLKHYRGF